MVWLVHVVSMNARRNWTGQLIPYDDSRFCDSVLVIWLYRTREELKKIFIVDRLFWGL